MYFYIRNYSDNVYLAILIYSKKIPDISSIYNCDLLKLYCLERIILITLAVVSCIQPFKLHLLWKNESWDLLTYSEYLVQDLKPHWFLGPDLRHFWKNIFLRFNMLFISVVKKISGYQKHLKTLKMTCRFHSWQNSAPLLSPLIYLTTPRPDFWLLRYFGEGPPLYSTDSADICHIRAAGPRGVEGHLQSK